MFTFIGQQKWYWQVVFVIISISAITICSQQFYSRRYDKDRVAFETRDQDRAIESAKLKAHADQLEKHIAELEPKLAAYEQLAEEKKKLDSSITDKINQVVEDGKKTDEEINVTIDCNTRAERTCSRFKELKPPIVIDCTEYKRKICS